MVALSLVANAVMAQQAGAGKPRHEPKGPVKVFILAGQSNMEGHAGVQTLDRLGEHPTHGYLLNRNGTWKLPGTKLAGLPAGIYDIKVTAKNSTRLVRTDSTSMSWQ
jgi:hypothetical protein